MLSWSYVTVKKDNRALVIYFATSLIVDSLETAFYVLALYLRPCLISVITESVPSAKDIYEILEKKPDTFAEFLKNIMFCRAFNAILKTIRIEQVLRDFWTP